jgi:hypothetical protein
MCAPRGMTSCRIDILLSMDILHRKCVYESPYSLLCARYFLTFVQEISTCKDHILLVPTLARLPLSWLCSGWLRLRLYVARTAFLASSLVAM